MKKILFVLCLGLFVGCNLYSQIRIHSDFVFRKPNESKDKYFIPGGLFSGIYYHFYENSQLKFEENYKNGESDGLFIIW